MGKKILVVEDDATCLKMTVGILAKSGYEVLEAQNGADAVRIATEALPDLILMDVQLPEMSGFEALDALRVATRTEDINIVALTAFTMPGDRERILATGYDGYIPKPITDLKAFLATVASFLK